MNNALYYLYGFVTGLSDTGFCIPIFYKVKDSKPILYFQDISPKGDDIIVGYTKIDSKYNMNLIKRMNSNNKKSFQVGDTPIFGFRLNVKYTNSNKTILIFDNRENLFRFFNYIFEKRIISDHCLIDEILNLYNNSVLKSHLNNSLNEKYPFEVAVILGNKNHNKKVPILKKSEDLVYKTRAITSLKINEFLNDSD